MLKTQIFLVFIILAITSCEVTIGEPETTTQKVTLDELFDGVEDPEDSEELAIYRNDSLNFEFGYPSNWKIPFNQQGQLIYVKKPDSYTETKPVTNFGITVQVNHPRKLEQLKDSIIQSWKIDSVITKVKILEEQDTLFNSQQAYKLVARGSFEKFNEQFHVSWKTVIFIWDGIMFKLTYTCPEDEFTEQTKTINSIFNSFHLLEEN